MCFYINDYYRFVTEIRAIGALRDGDQFVDEVQQSDGGHAEVGGGAARRGARADGGVPHAGRGAARARGRGAARARAGRRPARLPRRVHRRHARRHRRLGPRGQHHRLIHLFIQQTHYLGPSINYVTR